MTEVDICNGALRYLGSSKITGTTVAALAGTSKEERICAFWYPRVRDELLQRHPWNFAIARAALAPREITGDGGTAYTITAAEAAVGGTLSLLDGTETLWTLGTEYSLSGTDITTTSAVASSQTIKVRLAAPLGGEWSRQHFLPSGAKRVLRVVANDYKYEYMVEGGRILSDVDEATCVYIDGVTDLTLFDDLFVMALEARMAARMAYEVTGSASLVENLFGIAEEHEAKARTMDAFEGNRGAFETASDSDWLNAAY